MKKITLISCFALIAASATAFLNREVDIKIDRETTVDSLGACQGISNQNGRVFLYGDREVGMIREYRMQGDSLRYLEKEYKLTEKGQDVISHPTGIAYNGSDRVFIGNSVKLNPEGTRWKTTIYYVNWKGLLKTGTLDGNLLKTIDDDACIQGTRPEYVKYNNRWYVATADYGDHGNEVRLYDPEKLANCSKTSEPGVLFKKFTCTPWVQNLHWLPKEKMLVLIQNQVEGRRWRFTYVDFEASIKAGQMRVIKQIDLNQRADELEGFAFINKTKGIAVTSSRKNNVNYLNVQW
ncbi:hypothetical protein [Mucilaginibacter sp. CSA2-8R]|uniref:hypothetical protein n=1 Tax=Mucilaginibacter sp. CSA2-8R TaxID=3141542 RepID=UPI00315DD86F